MGGGWENSGCAEVCPNVMIPRMTDSGASARLPQPAPSGQANPATSGTHPPTAADSGSAPWLTNTPYARPITTESGAVRRPSRPTWRRWARRGFFLALMLIPLLILLITAGVYREARTASPTPSDAIVVLGAAQYNGRPSAVFEARLDTALELYNEGFAPLIVLTGGKMPGDAYTEAETGAQYLEDRGVPSSAILWENEGRDTWQSMQGVDAVLEGTDVESLIIVSDGFHLLRSELMARSLGFSATGAASDTSPIESWSASEFSYVVRETGGIIVQLPTFLGLG